MLVSLAWSCASGDATDFSERSTSSELSPASGPDTGDAAGQSDALSLETACIAQQVPQAQRETHHYTYDATRTTEKCYLTAIPELPLAPSTQTSGDEPREDQDQVEKTSTSPYAASYDPPSGVLTISAPEIQERKLKLTAPGGVSYWVKYTFSKKDPESGEARTLSDSFGSLTTSKHHIYFQKLTKLERYLRYSRLLMEHANYDHITLSSKNHVLTIAITKQEGTYTPYRIYWSYGLYINWWRTFLRDLITTYTLPPDNLRDFFIILGRYPLSTLGSPSTNPSEAVAKMFATQIIPLLLLAPSEP